MPPRVSRWEQRTGLDLLEHLKAIDYDLDNQDRNHETVLAEVRSVRTAVNRQTATIWVGIVIAVVSELIIRGGIG